jgi:hypothetical protein
MLAKATITISGESMAPLAVALSLKTLCMSSGSNRIEPNIPMPVMNTEKHEIEMMELLNNEGGIIGCLL